MRSFLIDTDVLSEPTKKRPDPRAVAWLRKHEADLYTSAVVVGEIAWGIERLPKSKKRLGLESWFSNVVIPKMAGRILRFDTRVALVWGTLQAELEAAGRTMPWRDSVIAATARWHGLVVATRNVRDYAQSAAKVVNPFLES